MLSLETKFNEANRKLKTDFNLITQAFIDFYGLENSEYIINKLKDLRIIWYDEPSDMSNNVFDNIITSISKEELEKILKERKKEVFLQSSYIDEFDILVLPLSYDLTKIIHEINHKIASHVISFKPLIQINGVSYSVEKDGIVEYNKSLNEAINQKMTLEIIEKLQNLGLKIEVTPSWQENLFPVINLFYDTFKNSLKELNISGNLEKFKNLLGNESFIQFSQLIYLCGYRIINTMMKEEKVRFSENKINSINNLVLVMKEHYDSLLQNDDKKSYK